MKKLLITIGGFIFLLTPALAFASSCTTGVYFNGSPTNSTQNVVDGGCNAMFSAMSTGDAFTITGSIANDGTYHLATWDPTGGGYGGGSVIIQESSWPAPGEDDTTGSVTFTFTPPGPGPSGNPIGDYLNGAEAGFASTTGFQIGSLITWSATNLIELFVGSGLGLLLALRYWIVALLIIAGIIFFTFRAFRFFRN